MRSQSIVMLIVVMSILSLFFISNGITGMVVKDPYTKGLCETDKDCNSPEVCCLFYQEPAGVCNDAKMCNSIYALRGQAKVQTIVASENSDKDFISITQFIVGALMVIMIGFMLHSLNKKHTKKHSW